MFIIGIYWSILVPEPLSYIILINFLKGAIWDNFALYLVPIIKNIGARTALFHGASWNKFSEQNQLQIKY